MEKEKSKKTKDDEVNGQGKRGKGRVPRPHTGRSGHVVNIIATFSSY